MLGKILSALFGRLTVSNRDLARASDQFTGYLTEEGFAEPERISRAARDAIVQEAHRIAVSKEKDGVARMGPFLDEVESAARDVKVWFRGEEGENPRIRSILVFHRLLDE